MSISLIVQSSNSEPLPIGSYFATFKTVQSFKSDKFDGERLKWVWEVVSGPCSGREASALTDTECKTTNKTGRLVAGMLGRAIQPGEDAAALIQSCVGKRYLLSVATGPKGGKAQVQTASLPPE